LYRRNHISHSANYATESLASSRWGRDRLPSWFVKRADRHVWSSASQPITLPKGRDSSFRRIAENPAGINLELIEEKAPKRALIWKISLLQRVAFCCLRHRRIVEMFDG